MTDSSVRWPVVSLLLEGEASPFLGLRLPEFTVVERRGRHYLQSARFRREMDVRELLGIANDLLALAMGVLGLGGIRECRVTALPHVVQSFGESRITDVYHLDGLELGSWPVNMPPRQRPRLPTEHHPRALELGLANAAVGNALVLRGDPNLDWVGLWMIYELIEKAVGGEAALEGRAWVGKAELVLFRRTANTVHRHAPGLFEPPPKPMLYGDARELVDRLLMAWIADNQCQAAAP